MRMLVVFMLALAGFAAAFTLSPKLRQRAVEILFGEEEAGVASQPRLATEVAGAGSAGEPTAQQQQDIPAAVGGRASGNVLPSLLGRVRFGMSPAEVAGAYEIAWRKQTASAITLGHYPQPDKRQMLEFEFAGDSLHLIRVSLEPAPGQALQELYEQRQKGWAEQFKDLKNPHTHWSDGTVNASLGLNEQSDCVEITFSAPSFKE